MKWRPSRAATIGGVDTPPSSSIAYRLSCMAIGKIYDGSRADGDATATPNNLEEPLIEVQEPSNNLEEPHSTIEQEGRAGVIIRTTCLMIIATAVVYEGMERLRDILIPFLLAVAISYLLAPIVDLLSCRGKTAGCRLPRIVAVFTAFLIGCFILTTVGLVLLQALNTFQERAPTYNHRIELLLERALAWFNSMQGSLRAGSHPAGGNSSHPAGGNSSSAELAPSDHSAVAQAKEHIQKFLANMSLTDLVLQLLGRAAHIAEDLMYTCTLAYLRTYVHACIRACMRTSPRVRCTLARLLTSICTRACMHALPRV